MTTNRRALAALAVGVLAAGALTAPAGAAPASSSGQAAVCSLRLGSVTPSGNHTQQTVTATPSASTRLVGPKDLYPDGQAHLPSSVGYEPVVPAGEQRQGLVAIGPRMYSSSYITDGTGTAVEPGTVNQTLIGGGWSDDLHYVERSEYSVPGFSRSNVYSLVVNPLDGLIARWTVTKDGWRYYTIHVPTGSGQPAVKKVRTSTWQSFDVLIAEKCGQHGTLLLGIDKDTGAGYVYAVGHANGAATVIQGRGKVPTTFSADDSYFRYFVGGPAAEKLYGE